MAYVCPRCEHNLKTVKCLWMHIRLKHSATLHSQWHCKQGKCIRPFADVYSFKKHLQSKHAFHIETRPVVHSSKNIEVNSYRELPDDALYDDDFQTPEQPLDEPQPYTSMIAEFKSALIEASSAFVSKLNSNPSITKAVTHEIVNYTIDLFNSGLIDILKRVHSDSSENNESQQFNELLDALSNPFEGLETAYKREKYLETAGYLIRPSAFLVGNEIHPKQIMDTTTVTVKDLTGQILPLKLIFKNFLELPNVFRSIESYMAECARHKEITCFLNGKLWTETKSKFPGKYLIPLQLYVDDVEINNPIGSRKGINKICGVYCKMLCIPPEYSSMLENIFVVQFHKSSDQHKFGNENVWAPLVNQLKYLEDEGISVKTEEGTRQVHFILSLFAGDNLGIHTNFGFHESFRSNHFCHICRADRTFLNTATMEDEQYLRTKSNFQNDLENLSHGIKADTMFHKLPNFHITENVYCDGMHDMFEGICRYVIPKVLHILVNIDKFLTIETLNNRIRFFDHGSVQTPNFTPPFTQDHLKNGMFICSASEMKWLLENLGLIIGDLIPVNNITWDVYLILREIHCRLLKNLITEDTAESLRSSIAKLNRVYQDIFEVDVLPCKLHFLTHYPRIVLKNGPVYSVSCMRLEAKHKEAKEYAHVCRSRKNICYSLLMKNQMSFAERLQAKRGFQERIQFGRSVQMESHQLPNYNSFNAFIPQSQLDEYQHLVSSIKINGTNYKTNMIVVTGEKENLLQFGKIIHILVSEKRNVAFILLNLRTKNFIRHVHSFSVELSADWSFVTHQSLHHYKPRNIHYLINGETCVSC